jgi:hypothetical protein
VRPTQNAEAPDGITAVIRFADDPERVRRLEEWQAEHLLWAAAEKPAREVLACFERFYELHALIERDAESLELLIGDGLLDWNLVDGRVHHPVLLQRVDLRFDPELAEFSVIDTDSEPEIYSALLQSIREVDGTSLRAIRDDLAAGGFHPLGGPATDGFLRSAITRLSARGTFVEDREGERAAGSGGGVTIRRAPVLFLRSRSLGFATCLQEVIDDLSTGSPIPPPLVRVVGIEARSTSLPDSNQISEGEREADPAARSADPILFSLPANPEQVRIAQRLESDGGVLVQGPPGTGKTHTIANLLGHLLANGKSVLVTSQTTKALKVLRDKVAPELQPLWVLRHRVCKSGGERRAAYTPG